MAELKITIYNEMGEIKCTAAGNDQVIMVYKGEYVTGDKILFETDQTNAYYMIRIDSSMDEAYVYLTKSSVQYDIPFYEKKLSYNPEAFTGTIHYITIRSTEDKENNSCRNLAKNVMDQYQDLGCYPHIYANVETRGEAAFAARNCIDGILANQFHGAWPYGSWGINQQDDAEITLKFGRPVDIEKIVLYTRADFPHDNWWTQATISFSDGSKQIVTMDKQIEPHKFIIEKKQIYWITLSNLIKSDDPSLFPALTQIEVYGTNS